MVVKCRSFHSKDYIPCAFLLWYGYRWCEGYFRHVTWTLKMLWGSILSRLVAFIGGNMKSKWFCPAAISPVYMKVGWRVGDTSPHLSMMCRRHVTPLCPENIFARLHHNYKSYKWRVGNLTFEVCPDTKKLKLNWIEYCIVLIEYC